MMLEHHARARPALSTLLAGLLLTLTACQSALRNDEAAREGTRPYDPSRVEAISLLGRNLMRPEMPQSTRDRFESELAEARETYEADPNREAAIIWLGRRTAYLGRYREAISIYTAGLETHPNSYKLRRHRGHRYITTRRLHSAESDLQEAARLIEGVPDEVEPDGLPNALNQPTSTSHTNIYYHLGLAHYLQGEYERAAEAYRSCLAFATNDDMHCAAAYWLYLTLQRLNRPGRAVQVLRDITTDMELIENHTYHRLLLLFKGELEPDAVLGAAPGSPVGADVEDATAAYGIAMWHMINGSEAEAVAQLQRIVEMDAWAAFGFIAAEADLARRSQSGR